MMGSETCFGLERCCICMSIITTSRSPVCRARTWISRVRTSKPSGLSCILALFWMGGGKPLCSGKKNERTKYFNSWLGCYFSNNFSFRCCWYCCCIFFFLSFLLVKRSLLKNLIQIKRFSRFNSINNSNSGSGSSSRTTHTHTKSYKRLCCFSLSPLSSFPCLTRTITNWIHL